MLSWSNQKDWSRKQATTQKRASHAISSDILSSSLMQAITRKYEASQPQQDSALDHISGFHFIQVKIWSIN